MKGLVSIIIPCYNSSFFLNRAVESCINQTYHNIEVVVIDDGSTDNTLSIISLWEKKDYRVHGFHKDNGGVSSARNYGLAMAHGDFIMFLDADDFFSPIIVESLVRNLQESGDCDMAVCSYTKKTSSNSICSNKEFFNYEEYAYLLSFSLKKVGLWSGLYKKEIIDIHSIDFPANIRYGEDLVFVWKYLVHCSRIVYTSAELYHYMDNSVSAMKSITKARFSSVDAGYLIIDYLSANGCPNHKDYKYLVQPRNILNVMHVLAANKNKELYDSFLGKYYERELFFLIWRFPDMRVRIAGVIAFISPKLFYCIFSFFNFIIK